MPEEIDPPTPPEVLAPAPEARPLEAAPLDAVALEAVAALELRLGRAFRDRATALASLTHKSYVNEHRDQILADNERLEFMGDAVIDLAVSHRLMERFPGAREGELSKMRAAVVDEQGLATLARTLDLGPLLRLGRGEELTGGRRKASLLADAMEAVVAAVYLEAGLEGVLAMVDRFLGEAFARAAAGTLDRDFKTQFQELAQSRLRAAPRYRVAAEHGPDHAKLFEVELEVRGEVLGTGQGKSKKDAEQAAARQAIEALARRAAAEAAAGLEPAGVEVASPSSAPPPLEEPPSPPPPQPPEPPPPARAPELVAAPATPAPSPRARPPRVPKKKAAAAARKRARPATKSARRSAAKPPRRGPAR